MTLDEMGKQLLHSRDQRLGSVSLRTEQPGCGVLIREESVLLPWKGESPRPPQPIRSLQSRSLGLGPVQFRDDLLLFHPAAASLEQAQDPLLVAQQFRRGPSGG